MALVFYNTLTKKKELFKQISSKMEVTMYNCGPTVYDYSHIGNFRSYMIADLLRRYLEIKGFKVKQVMNITDVGHMTFDEEADASGEDKIEKKAKEQKKDPYQIANFYTKTFFEDMKKLNMKRADVYPRATKHVKEMQELINKLMKKGYAYFANGWVYFSIERFKKYGKLSGNTIDKLKVGARLEAKADKKDPRDFALWAHDAAHIMQWDSPWGKGYPGWHIECSAMSMKYLGKTIDIHTGGEDNIFPHHECEIAQSEGATGKPFVKYWLHTRHLMINGKKMSKSLGNFYTLRDLVDKGYTPRAIRYLLLSAHYRTKLNLTEESLKAAEASVRRMQDFVNELKHVRQGKSSKKVDKLVNGVRKKFEEHMDDDLNTSLALGDIFYFMREVNKLLSKEHMSKANANSALKVIFHFDKVLGLDLEPKIWYSYRDAKGEIKQLIDARERFRKTKEWDKADSVREKLKKKGITVQDTEKGPRWIRST
ncbi:MAG: cysteine--tRNA ligase [Nanoarchaeota archaeon]|nr:cysteine--tRNA ligase [Nanoarchaeota archaeon]